MIAARIFHYTVADRYDQIHQDRLIKPATEAVPPGERPAVWFSVHPAWEPTANKGLRNLETGEYVRATREDMEVFGLVRIEVAAGAAPYRWKDYLRLSGVPLDHARGLERAARGWGANVHHWRVSFEPVPMEQWLGVERWSGTTWEPIPVSPLVLSDPRFAFIAHTPEQWEAFREAPVVVAREQKTGDLVGIVFGRDRVEQVARGGGEDIKALVVAIDPDSDELECLAAACLALKGRHDLSEGPTP